MSKNFNPLDMAASLAYAAVPQNLAEMNLKRQNKIAARGVAE